ncbi:MAG: PD-(D/E)XK nuclease domain-containing protein, partial [Succinatimonas hippei]|nr:PD-(D/E)XK nuclease domain-containing protein [Succinatimonas hippei]
TGMLSSFGDKLGDLKVEDEAGEGYADIKFSYDNELSAMVIELKVAGNVTQANSDVNKAIKQIEVKNYAREYLEKHEILNVLAVGLVFYGKDCVVAVKRLK